MRCGEPHINRVEMVKLIPKNESPLKLKVDQVARFSQQRKAKKVVSTYDALAGKPVMWWLRGLVKKILTTL
jgi:hypothetical protein